MLKLRSLPFSPYIATIWVSGVIFLAIIALRSAGYLEYLELLAYDGFVRLQPETSGSSPPIVIIGITEDDIRTQGRWPITDATMAAALDTLIGYKPRTIGLDIFRDIGVPPGSEAFYSILKENQYIIAVTKFGDNGVPPPHVISDTDRVGFNDILVDPGGIVRRGLLFLDDGEKIFYSFSLRLALQYLRVEGILPQPDLSNPQYIALGGTTIPPLEPNEGGYVRADARGYQFLVDFGSTPEVFQTFSLTSLLSGKVPSKDIRDKIIIIGVIAQSVKDLFYTPHSRRFRIYQQLPGVVVHAYIVNQLLRLALEGKRPRKSAGEKQEMVWILLWSVMGGLIGFRIRSPWLFSLIGSAKLLTLFLITYLAFLRAWWIPVVPPAMSWLISASIVTAYMSNREKKQRSLLMQLFSRYVSPEVADSIWQQRDEFLNNGRPRPQKLSVTVLFSDLKGFTSLSETLDPNSLVDWLNTYMESMTQAVMDHGGAVDDYIGDGIKANFGVPLPRDTQEEIRQDAVNAVNCALAMEREIRRLNNLWRKQNLPNTGIRIGIFSGSVVAAALGSTRRLKYTTIGDTVNIAARLESYDKNFAKESLCRILIGESTIYYLGDQFKSQMVGEEKLKGKKQKITIYQILGRM
jgi:adenylate cyclase